MAAVRKVVIIGGGIGGLTAAIALKKKGIEVKVFERAAELREVGAGLTLWSNGVTAFKKIDLAPSVIAVGSEVHTFHFTTSDKRILGTFDIQKMSQRIGSPSVSIHRKDLLHTLAAFLKDDDVVLDADCIGFEQDGNSATARFSNRESESADLLIGADGIHSAIRSQLFGERKPLRYAGYTCWRGVAQFINPDLPPHNLIQAIGSGSQFGLLDVGRGRVAWYATKNTPPTDSKESGQFLKKQLLERFADWHSPIPELLEATTAKAILKNDIYDRDPLPTFSRGRVCLLGDAAHPTTPNLGQGACQAIEDGVELARCLAEERTLETAIKRYEIERIGRTAIITKRSRLAGEMCQWDSPLKCRVRDSFMAFQFRNGIPGFESLLSYSGS